MGKLTNFVEVTGRLYEADLKIYDAKPEKYMANKKITLPNGMLFEGNRGIMGKLHIETTEGNVVEVRVDYTMAVKKKKVNGQVVKDAHGLEIYEPNPKFQTLEQIANNGLSVVKGDEFPTNIQVRTAMTTNDFVDQEGNIASPMVIAIGTFNGNVNIIPQVKEAKAEFKVDLVFGAVQDVLDKDGMLKDDEKYITGLVFDFFDNMYPVRLKIKNPKGIDFFMGLEKGDTLNVWGEYISEKIKKETVTQSAFGEDLIQVSEFTRREVLLKGANPNLFDDDKAPTPEFISQANQNRQLKLAEIKAQAEQRKQQQAAPRISQPQAPASTPSRFDF